MSIYDEEAGTVDVDGILGESLISRQNVTPGQFGLLVLGNRMTLLGEGNSSTHASPRSNKAFESQSQYGTKVQWTKLEALYSKQFTGGISQIKLQQSVTTISNENTIIEVEGTVAIDPQDAMTMLFTVDSDSVPTNTLDAVDAVINPLTFNPTGASVGTRYLLTESIGNPVNSESKSASDTDTRASDDTPPPSADTEPNTASAWGNTIASVNDIVQLNADGFWDRKFDANANTDFSDSTYTTQQYVTNLTSGIQYKWVPANSMWVKSYEGFYEPGTWSITF